MNTCPCGQRIPRNRVYCHRHLRILYQRQQQERWTAARQRLDSPYAPLYGGVTYLDHVEGLLEAEESEA